MSEDLEISCVAKVSNYGLGNAISIQDPLYQILMRLWAACPSPGDLHALDTI